MLAVQQVLNDHKALQGTNGQTGTTEQLFEKAKLAYHIGRYHDMAKAMKELAKLNHHLTEVQRDLLSVACDEIVKSRRSARNAMHALWQKNRNGSALAGKYLDELNTELQEWCLEVLNLLDDLVCSDAECKVFYNKMRGDYNRYLAEISTGAQRDEFVSQVKKAYEFVLLSRLTATHPLRLEVALHYSVFCYEILGDTGKACKLAKEAFDDAFEQLETLKEDSYPETTLIMQHLRDNLTRWTSKYEDW